MVYPVIAQLTGGVSAAQLNVTPVCVMLADVSPVGVPGTAVQLPPLPLPWQGPTRDHNAGTLGGCQSGEADTSG